MKKSVKALSVILSAVTAASMMSATVFASDKPFSWVQENGKTYYYTESGDMVTKNTVIDGIRYKFGKDGECLGKYTGWTKTSKGRCYYKNGVKQKNRWVKFKSGKQYYIGADGYAAASWNNVDGDWKYFSENGEAVTGSVELFGKTYTFTEEGFWNHKCDNSAASIYFSLEKKLPKGATGGLYLDNGGIVIMTKDRKAVEEMLPKYLKKFAVVQLKECKYSVNELEAVKSYLDENHEKLGIKGFNTNTKKNCIEIVVASVNDELQAYLDKVGDIVVVD